MKRNDALSFLALSFLLYITYLHSKKTASTIHSQSIYPIATSTSSRDYTQVKPKKKSSSFLRTDHVSKKPLPAFFDKFGDVTEPFDKKEGDIPYFWHVSRSGGSSVKDILGGCLGLVQASDVGARERHGEDTAIKVVRLNGAKYLNIDTSTTEGIERAKKLDAMGSGKFDALVSHRFVEAADLFTFQHRAKLFTVFRDPIERAVSMFYYLSTAKWEKTYDPDLMMYELTDYAKTSRIENNWMVRSLVNKMEGFLTVEDLELAMEILRKKCLIGLLSEKEESIKRFEKYFGWERRSKLPGASECEERLLGWGWSNKNRHPPIDPGSEAYYLIKTKNELDIMLYEYAKVLFHQQGEELGLATHTKTAFVSNTQEINEDDVVEEILAPVAPSQEVQETAQDKNPEAEETANL